MEKDSFINIPRDLYDTLMDSFNKVISVYQENGELKGKLIALESEKNLLIELQNNNNYQKVNNATENQSKLLYENENLQNFQNDEVNLSETSNNEDSEELVFSTKQDNEANIKSIKNSSRIVGFWIFTLSLLSIFVNFWIQNFSLIARDIYITLGIFSPFMFGGLLAILNPKLPGTFGWILTFFTSTFFTLHYFDILNYF